MTHDIVRNPPQGAVILLLEAARLPLTDITPAHLEHFFGAWSGSVLDGVVGIEPLGSAALLRSLTVATPRRGIGLGAALLAHAERYAAGRDARDLYLLTTTAQHYFAHRGYAAISRDAAPDALRRTAEFSALCPSSAVLMVKRL